VSEDGLIQNRAWVARQLEQGHSVTEIARLAGVSRQTASTWIRRHGLASTAPSRGRPSPSRLRALYRQSGSVAGVGKELGVTKGTAHRWLAEAGVELAQEGARGLPRPTPGQLQRLHAQHGTQKAVAESLNVTLRTVQRWFADLERAARSD
jgi:hypothetical protein